MSTEAEAYIERLDQLRGEFKSILRGMDAEALNWNPPAPDTNSPYALGVHIAGTEASRIHEFVGELAINRDREAEFRRQGADVSEVERLLDQTGATTRSILKGLTSDDLSQTKQSRPGEGIVSLRWSVLYAISAISQHLGHLTLTKQLYEASKGQS